MMKGVTDSPHYDRGGKQVPYFTFHARAISRAAAVGHGEVLLKHAETLARRAKALLAARRPPGAAAEEGMRAHADDVMNMYNVEAEQLDEERADTFLNSIHLNAQGVPSPHTVGA